jgi:hypothetical protein
MDHRVDRVLGFFSSRPNWFGHPPPPHPQVSVSPLFGSGGGTDSLAGEGVWAHKSDEGTDTMVILVYIFFFFLVWTDGS